MTRQPVLIASDLDGTIVCGGREIPRRTEEALRRFVRNGGLFTVATGRAIGSAFSYQPNVRSSKLLRFQRAN